MIPWELIDTALVDGQKLGLYRRGAEYSIRIGHDELMNSRLHGSEEALARLACEAIANRPEPHVLVGGLGMGFTLGAALALLGPTARVTVAELAGAVIAWNRGPLAHLAGHPLEDPRVTVYQGDIVEMVRKSPGAFNAVILDVDNGPQALTSGSNSRLYSQRGLKLIKKSLKPEGVFTLWSAHWEKAISRTLHLAGFTSEAKSVPARSGGKGSRHTLWIAR